MNIVKVNITLNAEKLTQQLAEVCEITERRASFPQFRNLLLEIGEALGSGIESPGIYADDGATGTPNFVLYPQFGKGLLDLVSALRALDRDVDIDLAHGDSFRD